MATNQSQNKEGFIPRSGTPRTISTCLFWLGLCTRVIYHLLWSKNKMLVGDCYVLFQYDTEEERFGWCYTNIWIHSLNHASSATYIASITSEDEHPQHWISGYILWEVVNFKNYQFMLTDPPADQLSATFIWKECKTPLPATATKLSIGSRFYLLHPQWRQISRKTRRALFRAAALPGPLLRSCGDWVCEREWTGINMMIYHYFSLRWCWLATVIFCFSTKRYTRTVTGVILLFGFTRWITIWCGYPQHV